MDSPDEARADKVRKAHGTQVACPNCGNTEGPFNPEFRMPRVDIFTCPQCRVEFNAYDNSLAPFTVTCDGCQTDQPISNERCYMCANDLALAIAGERAKAVSSIQVGQLYVHCASCRNRVVKGTRQCRCGEFLTETGEIMRIGPPRE